MSASSEAPPLASNEGWVSPAMFFEAAERQLASAWKPHFSRMEVSMPRQGVRGLVIDAGPYELVARAPQPHRNMSARMSVWVDVRQGGVSRRSVLVPVQVRAWQSGMVALRDMAAGSRLSSELLQEAEVDVAAGGQWAWQGKVDNQVLRTPVLAGHYVGVQQVGTPHAVSRGERVELLHQVGAVRVSAAANALQDGDAGQHIHVRIDAAQGAVLARVIEPGRVELIK
ncbi:MAG TPA: flagellar basal body P-ring formation chaperone FlgA [Ideonella sp.]|uniref:flagellar basal body P-ring formation chaperone FlgA n=1 Tax=Ideonella sp. TaxID=1929293 RepID=UPI002E31A855|nr:flagellar basal body P-ring formation chaperone FlgA [Ideonella sp.]HEX5682644.1 flagellar basal body P-ring formation chaperone FlgA [Ideonella sp.]